MADRRIDPSAYLALVAFVTNAMKSLASALLVNSEPVRNRDRERRSSDCYWKYFTGKKDENSQLGQTTATAAPVL